MKMLDPIYETYYEEIINEKRRSMRWIIGGTITAFSGVLLGFITRNPEVAASGIMIGTLSSGIGISSYEPLDLQERDLHKEEIFAEECELFLDSLSSQDS